MNKSNVTWSPTERGEVGDYYYSSVFELTGQGLKEESRSIPKVTNPGQNGNQQMFVLCDRMGKE